MKKFLLLILVICFLVLALPGRALECEGDPPSGDANALQQYSQKCEQQILKLRSEQKTLKDAINLLNTQINLAAAQIKATNVQIEELEKAIQDLGLVISNLDQELNNLTQVFSSHVRQSYKNRQLDPLTLLITSNSLASFQSQLKYLETARLRDQIIIRELDSARTDYHQQKTTKEEKQAEIQALKARLTQQQTSLSRQQQSKNILLKETQNSEKIYQDRLTKAVAELQAIESIIAGQGSETEVGTVSQGQKIATIILGASACSTGSHLHFEVVNNQSHQNPAAFLKNISVIWDNAPDAPFSFSGSWDWPLSEPLRITQGYGHTAYSSRYASNQHTGIDMVNSDNYEVKAVKSGTLYRGSIACGGGTLKYVHLKHSDDNLDTYYLHVNYF